MQIKPKLHLYNILIKNTSEFVYILKKKQQTIVFIVFIKKIKNNLIYTINNKKPTRRKLETVPKISC